MLYYVVNCFCYYFYCYFLLQAKSDVQALESSEKPTESHVVDENKYKKEITKGALPIAGLKWGPNSIVLDSDPHSVYGKVLEESYPPAADNWYDWRSKSTKQIAKVQGKVVKGMHKWKGYPELIEVCSLLSHYKVLIVIIMTLGYMMIIHDDSFIMMSDGNDC